MKTFAAFLVLCSSISAADLGQWEIDDVLTFTATTHDPLTGVATDADAVPTYRIYEDETGAAILTGSTALLDAGNTNGLYSEAITLSLANGFEVGNTYTIVKTATVGGVTGNAVDTFQLTSVPTQVASILGDTTTTASLVGDINTIVGGTDTSVTSIYNQTTAIQQQSNLATALGSYDAATGTDVTAIATLIGTPAGDDLAADIAEVAESISASLIDPEFVAEGHVWRFESVDQVTAKPRIREIVGFDGMLEMDFDRVLSRNTSIASASVTVDDAEGVTLGTTSLHPNKRGVKVPVEVDAAGTYTFSVEVVTVDSQTFIRKGILLVE